MKWLVWSACTSALIWSDWNEVTFFPWVWSDAKRWSVWDPDSGYFFMNSALTPLMLDVWPEVTEIFDNTQIKNVLFDINTKLKRHGLISQGNNRPSNEFIIELWARRASVAFSSTVSYRFNSNIIPKEKLKQSSLFF